MPFGLLYNSSLHFTVLHLHFLSFFTLDGDLHRQSDRFRRVFVLLLTKALFYLFSFHKMEHGRLLDLQRFSQTQQRALNHQWKRDLEELLARALATLQEAKHAHQEELELYRDRQHQQDICLHLREKVSISYLHAKSCCMWLKRPKPHWTTLFLYFH